MKRGQKKKYWKIAGGLVLLLFAVLAGTTAWYENSQKELYREALQNMERQVESYQHYVYVAAEELPKGTILTEENTRRELCVLNQDMEYFFSEEDLGSVVITDIPEGVSLLKVMVQCGDEKFREVYLSEVKLAGHLATGDRIDVRIRYSNAEDYIVLSDKLLLFCDNSAGMVIQMTEEEILLFSSAMADCERYDNTRLYAVKYPEFRQTEESMVNYPALQEIQEMLGISEKYGKERAALEQRLEREES